MSNTPQSGTAAVTFTGTRSELFGQLFVGYLLMLPTLGIYRFWVTTQTRRYYWKHTAIGGDPLEYTGNALQLLVGFLFALAFFLPIYLAFFYFSTQAGAVALAGYGVVGALLWFLAGYAFYRGRDFRLSRTLWRGIRFDVKGSAWGYALRRFGWSILVLVTAGLAYPFMAGNLWRYRWNNTWFGDRKMSFAGSWKSLAVPFYLLWFGIALPLLLMFYFIGSGDVGEVGSRSVPGAGVSLSALAALVVAGLGWFYFRARETTRMYSAIRVGEAAVTVRVTARRLFGQFLLYSLMLGITLLVVLGVGFAIFMAIAAPHLGTSVAAGVDIQSLARVGWIGIAAIIFGYLALFGDFALMGEVFLGWGYWSAVARNATVSNIESLADVRAVAEDPALVGEGLADALNVGSF
jgi:uncharacterized membrane protein YjgN (DUF898 family)